MGENSKIEWTDATWNPTVGCSVISPGCTNCYAMRMAGRLETMGNPVYRGHTIKTKAGRVWNGKVSASNHSQMLKPLSWQKPRRIFVNSMSDLFHEDMPDDVIDQVFAVMALCPQHEFQVLTKRSGRMREYLISRDGMGNAAICTAINKIPAMLGNRHGALEMPLPNVWLGISCEDQARANERIPDLLATPAEIRFLSCEPLLGPLRLQALTPKPHHELDSLRGESWRWGAEGVRYDIVKDGPRISWVIAGGESGPRARPPMIGWVRSLRDQCAYADVPFHFKQWGEYTPDDPTARHSAMRRVGKKLAGALLDGVEHRAFPT